MKHLFSHKGRANRLEFVFWGAIFNTLSALFFITQMEMGQRLAASPTASLQDMLLAGMLSIVLGLLGIVVGWCALTLYARRLHDLNLRGWWYLALVAVLVILSMLSPVTMWLARICGVAFFLWVALTPGKNEENRFGPEPATEGFYPRAMTQKPVFVAFMVFALAVMFAQSLYSMKLADVQTQRMQTYQAVQR